MSAVPRPELPATPRDPAGAETLAIMQAAPRYHAWQYQAVAPFLGRRLAELGAGFGTMSAHLLSGKPDLLVLTDTDESYLSGLRTRFGGEPSVSVEALTIPDPAKGTGFKRYKLDTVVAFNVLEHVPQDSAALETAAGMLMPGGRVVVLVPALPALYGSLDIELGHARRYTPRSLRVAVQAGGFVVEHLRYFNIVGSLGWWLSARVRRQPRIPLGQLRLFDACVPALRLERFLPLPFGQSLIAVGRLRAR